MILPKRTVYALLITLTLANIMFRYPVNTEHELGTDTTFIHSLAISIVHEGRAVWIIHPMSFFGLYALSYPSAIPFFFAATTILGGIPIEGFMLILGWVVSFVGAMGAFLVARKLRRDDRFALLIAILFSFAPFFIKDTFWIGSTRGFVVGLLPVFLLLTVRSLRTREIRDIALALILFVILATIHRMGFLAFFFLVACIFAIPFHKVTQRLRFALIRYERPARYVIVFIAVLSFFGTFYLQFVYPGIAGANIIDQYSKGAFFEGEAFPILVTNMGISLSGKVGPLFPFALLGLIVYIWRRPKEATDTFLLTAALLFIPLLSLRDYMAEFLIPIFVLFLVVGLLWVRERRRTVMTIIVALLIIGSVGTSFVLKDYWRQEYLSDAPIPKPTYDTAVYIRYTTDGSIVANDGLTGGQIAAVSGRPILPLGGASLHWTGPQQIAWGYVSADSVYVRLLSINNITFNTDEIYVPVNVRNAEVDWETMLYYTQPAAAELQFRRYDVHYIVVNMDRPNTFLAFSRERSSVFLTSTLPSSSYAVYQNGAFTVWYRG